VKLEQLANSEILGEQTADELAAAEKVSKWHELLTFNFQKAFAVVKALLVEDFEQKLDNKSLYYAVFKELIKNWLGKHNEFGLSE